jgi:hypothetical protein
MPFGFATFDPSTIADRKQYIQDLCFVKIEYVPIDHSIDITLL